eukprot:gene62541-85532_t
MNGYTYTVGCEDGQEQHLLSMAGQVESRINSIKALGGQSGESRLLALAALLMADELHDMKTELDAARAAPKGAKPAKAGPDVSKRMHKLAARAEAIADGLEQAAYKQLPGNWLCRDRGPDTWCPPAQAGSGRMTTPTAMVAPHNSLDDAKRAARKGALAAR